ncbi:MAG: hypothetical protein K9G39_00840 [Chlorobium sp.]|uniref:hypothetical protein n=1 Tax=Chlorobium sp. TaxID=1095 RepID=UPI0025C5AA62|nr:hypothetical protein [Chlorobium sp.]MCF8382131.1 hypothetical protein [Chlorobium sp.]
MGTREHAFRALGIDAEAVLVGSRRLVEVDSENLRFVIGRHAARSLLYFHIR